MTRAIAAIIWMALAVYIFCGARKRNKRLNEVLDELKEKQEVWGGVPDALEDDEICRAALETFGERAQMGMAVEEMSELVKELCKRLRGRDNLEAIAEEIADVQIMLRQMIILFDCGAAVEKFHRYKLERLARRVEEAKQ